MATIVYEKVSDDLARKTSVDDIDLKKLKEELANIDRYLIEIAKEPDEILQPNIIKKQNDNMFKRRKAEIEKLLEACK